jgi:hypothetical protein
LSGASVEDDRFWHGSTVRCAAAIPSAIRGTSDVPAGCAGGVLLTHSGHSRAYPVPEKLTSSASPRRVHDWPDYRGEAISPADPPCAGRRTSARHPRGACSEPAAFACRRSCISGRSQDLACLCTGLVELPQLREIGGQPDMAFRLPGSRHDRASARRTGSQVEGFAVGPLPSAHSAQAARRWLPRQPALSAEHHDNSDGPCDASPETFAPTGGT